MKKKHIIWIALLEASVILVLVVVLIANSSRSIDNSDDIVFTVQIEDGPGQPTSLQIPHLELPDSEIEYIRSEDAEFTDEELYKLLDTRLQMVGIKLSPRYLTMICETESISAEKISFQSMYFIQYQQFSILSIDTQTA